ncbi:hypothetical protein HOY34_14005 [Xinfangfangia sp. D13-10-4-6]|uniref:hypothetical protein n=1 Tax=Pseudogemmobacter hezensis TaxID=2737662 RepID=UPI0015568DDD|nr:hypothetical protein [Pseudogemmobacter hezensis]NPD16309.1 hypothetical protein [Pseudogemmobacter hezensis]
MPDQSADQSRLPSSDPDALPTGLRKYLTLRNITWLLLALILVRAISAWAGLAERMEKADNDDLLRMVMVRDWLAGQSWFDTQQYRLLPPEGVSIHWSRYIDAAIGGIISLAALFMSMPVAEHVALIAWPTILMVLLLLLNGFGSRATLGDVGAVGAMLCVFFWTKLAGFEFAPGRIDHHNVQILAMTALIFSLIWPQKSARCQVLAALAGALASALSLAVGLEMLPVLLLIWGIAGLRFAFGAAGAGRWLLTFALSLAVFAPLMMAGQIPAAAWAIRYCDALAPPMLSLLAVGVVVSAVPVLLGQWLRGPGLRILAMVALLALGLWLAAPLLGPCLSGPYGAMSPEARAVITTRIGEAQPALSVAIERGVSFDFLLLYILVLMPVVTLQAWFVRRRLGAALGFALVVMLAIGWLGLLASLGQIRAITLGTPAIPFLTGFALWHLTRGGQETPGRGGLLAVFLGTLLMAVPTEVMKPVRKAFAAVVSGSGEAMPESSDDISRVANDAGSPAEPGEPTPTIGLCRTAETMAELRSLPPSLIAETTNLGMPLLYFTRHSATAAPYHRSGDSFWNGVEPFEAGAEMQKMLRKSGADYVILCRQQDYAHSDMHFAQSLLDGETPAWLIPVDPSGKGKDSQLVVLQVDKAALAQTP